MDQDGRYQEQGKTLSHAPQLLLSKQWLKSLLAARSSWVSLLALKRVNSIPQN